MTTSEKTPVTRFFTTIAGDAFLFSTAAFGILMAAFALIMLFAPGLSGPEGPVGAVGSIVAGLGNLLGLAAMVAGPVIVWRMHGREVNNVAIAGMALGVIIGIVGVAACALALTGIAMAIGNLTGMEFAGLIVVGAALVVTVLVIAARLDTAAIRDLAPERSEHRQLDVMRLVATGVLLLVFVAVGLAATLGPNGEVAEAIPFAIGAGAFAAFAVAVADAWVRRAERKHAETGAAVGI